MKLDLNNVWIKIMFGIKIMFRLHFLTLISSHKGVNLNFEVMAGQNEGTFDCDKTNEGGAPK